MNDKGGLPRRHESSAPGVHDDGILFPDQPIIDAHHHLYARPHLTYLLDDYIADTRKGHPMRASVLVEADGARRISGPGHLRPLAEVEFAEEVAVLCRDRYPDDCRVAAAVIGHADLRMGTLVGEYLDLAVAVAPGRFRGVRQITMSHRDPSVFRHLAKLPDADIMKHPHFHSGARELARRDLVFEVTVLHHQLPEVTILARALPELTINLCHAGLALSADPTVEARAEAFVAWRAAMVELATCPNVNCKVGGFGTSYWGFGLERRRGSIDYVELAELWGPYVDVAVSAFGADRCMMASNFPNDGRSSGFVALWNALKFIAVQYAPSERADLLEGTAARVYGID
jgi:predicted TIM-barrel fold metal-dependent hydrolase